MQVLLAFQAQAHTVLKGRQTKRQRHLMDLALQVSVESWQLQWHQDQVYTRSHAPLATCPGTQAHALTWRTSESEEDNKQNRQFHFMQIYLALVFEKT